MLMFSLNLSASMSKEEGRRKWIWIPLLVFTAYNTDSSDVFLSFFVEYAVGICIM